METVNVIELNKDEITVPPPATSSVKRGRKKKTDPMLKPEHNNNNIVMIIEELDTPPLPLTSNIDAAVLKKRGRKPKGGKLIAKKDENIEQSSQVANVILHLKCSVQDLNEHNSKINKLFTNPMSYNPSVPPSIMTYDINQNSPSFSVYENISKIEPEMPSRITPEIVSAIDNNNNNKVLAYDEYVPKQNVTDNICQVCNEKFDNNTTEQNKDDYDDLNIKDINLKLKNLKLQLYKNNNLDKKSACFWCTHDYDNQPCYIPKYEMDGTLYGYGSFCRPECAVAYLMKESIDDSMKFERYHLLNQIYSKVYNFKKNIKPAPNPFFLLDKFYGNLTIQEYRKLLKTEHMLLVVEKPMTLILPELHDDNDDFIMNIYGGKSTSLKTENINHNGIYKVKKQSEKLKGPTKTSIMKEHFGM